MLSVSSTPPPGSPGAGQLSPEESTQAWGGGFPGHVRADTPFPPISAAHLDVTGPPEPILARVGEAAELSCRLPPGMGAGLTELRWVRGRLSPTMLVARAGGAQDAEPGPGYRGRAELLPDAPDRVALRLHGVRASDDGEYRCILRQGDSHGEASVRLQVAGEHPGAQVRTGVKTGGRPKVLG